MDLALWDANLTRAKNLKNRLDMFVPEDKEAAILPPAPQYPIEVHDAVFLSFDECDEPVLRVARTVRQSSEITFILLVSDRSRDLSPFFRPKIRPGGVLFRPVQNINLRNLLDEVAEELDRLTQAGSEDMFLFRTEGASHRTPFRDILFFEARNKKVIMRTLGQEIGFYGTIENLSASLPPYFVRCHRSFLVNSLKIEEMRGADMELKLTGGVRIPFSRSCCETVKRALTS